MVASVTNSDVVINEDVVESVVVVEVDVFVVVDVVVVVVDFVVDVVEEMVVPVTTSSVPTGVVVVLLDKGINTSDFADCIGIVPDVDTTNPINATVTTDAVIFITLFFMIFLRTTFFVPSSLSLKFFIVINFLSISIGVCWFT